MIRRILPAIAVMSLLMAGCQAPTPNETPENNPGNPDTSQPTDAPTNATFQLPDRIAFTECTGASTLFDSSADAYPGNRPSSWEPSTTRGTSIDIRLFQCERISVGPYERGPIVMALEHHSNIHIPDACAHGTFTYPQMMSFLHVNDSEIAEYLAGALGMPASAADFSVSYDTSPGEQVEAWRWQQGTDSYELLVPRTDVNRQHRAPLVERVFWFNETHLGSMDLSLEISDDTGGVTTGTMGAESVYKQGGLGVANYLGRGGTSIPLVAEAQMHSYEDFQCGLHSP